jgi:hypothetical protein
LTVTFTTAAEATVIHARLIKRPYPDY